MISLPDVEQRAAVHAALGDPVRLRLVDELAVSDRSPSELRRSLGIESNLLAHHLDALESVGLITRSRSTGDRRRRYVHLLRHQLGALVVGHAIRPEPALFVCTANSARSQLAAALWRRLSGAPGDSAGTHPADKVHPGAVDAAERAGLDLSTAEPRALNESELLPALVITVCDSAHEQSADGAGWLHWSIPDPVPVGTAAAFDATIRELRERMHSVLDTDRAAS